MTEYIYEHVTSGDDATGNPVEAPTLVQRVEIVRCRDCEHFTLEGSYRFEDGSTNVDFCEYVRGWLLQVTPDGFCAWGERKVGE